MTKSDSIHNGNQHYDGRDSHRDRDVPEGALVEEPVSSSSAASDDTSSARHQTQDELEVRVAELTEALQRERADATNLRRRHAEEMASLKGHVKAGVVRDLLPVIDNLERALKHVPEDLADNEYVKGVQGVVKQFEKTLAGIGVERIATVGQSFDPEYHEAISMEEGDGTEEVISEELQAGYKLGDEVVRHAMVRVTLR
jgi:molecular chaperone GrpE